ncbi:MAG: (d)CMP kinase [Actinobacteria bacterium]|nr:(d)CMP kinase [Actinomycetota bacterium]
MVTPVVVAVDGPAGSGKSTVARAIAAELGLEVLDTGAMYRAVTLAVLQAGVDPDDDRAVADLAQVSVIEVGEVVWVNGVDASHDIRGPEVTGAVSRVSANPSVRDLLVERQRQWVADHGGGVVEGRDIGTVVFPDSPLKVYLTADSSTRAARRHLDEQVAQRQVGVDDVRADLQRRDALDSGRAVAPLRPAPDAVVIDTSGMSVEDVVKRVLQEARSVGLVE